MKEVRSIVEKLFDLIGVEASFDVKREKQTDGEVIKIAINAEREAGLLIGARGSTLHALQSFIAMALKQKTGEWVRVVLDIGDWRKKQEEYLSELARQAVDRVLSTGEPQYLYNLSPSQRRIIHVALAKEKGIKTQSEGEGEGRALIVSPNE